MPPSVRAALERCGLLDGPAPRLPHQPRQPGQPRRRRRLAALAAGRGPGRGPGQGAARDAARGASRQPKRLELAHRYRVCGAGSGRNVSAVGGNRASSAADADVGRRGDAGRGTSGGEGGAPSRRRASALSGGLQLQLRRECRDVLRWFTDGSLPETASSGAASTAAEAPTAGADLGRAWRY